MRRPWRCACPLAGARVNTAGHVFQHRLVVMLAQAQVPGRPQNITATHDQSYHWPNAQGGPRSSGRQQTNWPARCAKRHLSRRQSCGRQSGRVRSRGYWISPHPRPSLHWCQCGKARQSVNCGAGAGSLARADGIIAKACCVGSPATMTNSTADPANCAALNITSSDPSIAASPSALV